ncbi:MAG: site-specific DNA-methyltransferase [Lachnospiraceae bacterium]|nr:site-specific DNA-methyltransferase [Lachnospiraceae bacterium]
MANLSQIKREQMISFLEKLKEQHSDDESLIAINQIEKELTSKKYGLVWEEHEEEVDVKMQTHIPVFTEDKEKEIVGNPESDEYNFLLEGDNLHSLKLLEKTHKGKIDVIYIDPPYNTGNKDFKYDDNYIEKDDTFKHSKWLSFISKKLLIARKLLNSSGVIFISIDDYEYAELQILCDEIFGSMNYMCTFVWKVTGHTDNQDEITKNHEYILCYAKNKFFTQINNVVDPNIGEESKIKRDFAENSITKNGYKNPPSFIDLPIGFPCETECLHRDRMENFAEFYAEVMSNKFISRELSKKYGAIYPIPITDMDVEDYKLVTPCKVFSGWMNNGKLKRFIENKCQPINDGNTKVKFFLSKNGVIYYRRDNRQSHYVQTVLENMGTTETNRYMLEDMGFAFDYPKPIQLIKYLLSLYAKNDAVILDFFAGSGTTGHAVLEHNNETSDTWKVILCTNNENNICEEVTYQRLKTVITGLRADGSQYSDGLPSNLKYYKTDFISKDNEELYDNLLDHIVEMIQLQYGVKVDNEKYVIIMDDDEMDEFEKNFQKYKELKALFINQDILLTTSQERLLSNVNTFIIPDCYFDPELREAGELW